MNDSVDTFPEGLYYLIEHQVWARLNADGRATVGITSLGIRLAGEIYMCRPKAVGSVVEQGRSIAVVELAKSIVSVKSPISGTVVAVNEALAQKPELVHLDPYGAGWMATLQPSDFDADAEALVHEPEVVRAAMARHAWLNRVDNTDGGMS